MDSEPKATQSATQGTLGPKDYAHFVRDRWWLIVLVVVVVTVVTAWLSARQPPQYQATAEVIHESGGLENNLLGIAAMTYLYQQRIPVDAHLLASPEMAAQVKEDIGSQRSPEQLLGMIGVQPAPDTESIWVNAYSQDPVEAAAIANGFVDTFVASRTQELKSSLTAARGVLQEQIAQVPADEKDSPYARALDDRLKQLSVLDYVALEDYRVLRRAEVPGVPFAPSPVRDTIVAFIVALVAAIGLALLIEYFDKRIRDEEGMERSFGAPVLASIPLVRRHTRRRRHTPGGGTQGEPVEAAQVAESAGQIGIGFHGDHRALLEPYMMLRSNLQYFGVDRQMRLVMITSTFPQQGKTTVTINLGLAMALAGERVLVVECDMRRPKIHQYLGLSNEVGLANVLAGTVSFEDAIQPLDISEWVPTSTGGHKLGDGSAASNLFILCAGPTPPNAS